ncbi:hypothetical protein SAMN04515666_101349 [Bosea lupini]|uniref:Gluconate 2-dehydrogenase subunit 3 n=1 Tax=Bosea lupini TaxID=1036779 RepID=A0A1H7GGL6_9HYPH|nr:hypothetical protein [Bosea lupini]SEK37224.1 hypothetical protein SAMN04515666_101349 [Bosea lupini]
MITMRRYALGLWAVLALAPEGDGAGAPPPAGTGGQPQGDGGAGGGAAFVPPDFLPEHLRGKDAVETLGKLAPEWKTQRDSLAQRWTPPPEKPDGYEFAPAPELKQFFAEDAGKDPVVGVLRGVAHKIGMSADKFAPFVNEAVGELQKAGLIGKDQGAPDYDAEMKALVPEDKRSAPEAEQKAAAKARHDNAQTFADTLLARKDIDEGMREEFGLLLESANGVRLVEMMITHMTGEKGFVFGGQGGGGSGYTMADYNRDSADPRYNSNSPKYDPAFRQETDNKSKHLWK